MTEREKFLLRMAVIYLIANLDDACEAFVPAFIEDLTDKGNLISVNGEVEVEPDESELDHLMRTLQ
jgi:hypothetical protein